MRKYDKNELVKGNIYTTEDYRCLEFIEKRNDNIATFYEIIEEDCECIRIEEPIYLTINELYFE